MATAYGKRTKMPKTPEEWRNFRAQHAMKNAQRKKSARVNQEFNDKRGPRVFGYGRASTKKQEASPETQKMKMKEYVSFARNSGYIPEDMGEPTFFIDAAVSGKVPWSEREAGKVLLGQLRPGD